MTNPPQQPDPYGNPPEQPKPYEHQQPGAHGPYGQPWQPWLGQPPIVNNVHINTGPPAPVYMTPPASKSNAGKGCLLGCGGLIALGTAAALAEYSPAALAVLALLGAGGGTIAWRQRKKRKAVEQARVKEQEEREAWEAKLAHIGIYHRMNSEEFDQAIAHLCGRDGCRDVVSLEGDGVFGGNVCAIAPDGARIVMQCWRYEPGHDVSELELSAFGDVCYSVHQADIAAVVTTSDFTPEAREYAEKHQIRLFGNQRLARWAARTGRAPWM